MHKETKVTLPKSNERSNYDLTSNAALSTVIGALTPIYWQEVVPSGRYNIKPIVKIQFSPMVGPVYGLFKAKIRTFFVPMSQIWKNFSQHYATADNSTYPHPYRSVNMNTIYSTLMNNSWQFFGTGISTDTDNQNLNILPMRAYMKIWLEKYYKGEQLPNPDTYYLRTDGNDTGTHDYVKYDYYNETSLDRRLGIQFYGGTPSVDGSVNPFTLQDLQTLIAKSKQASLMARFAYRAQDLISNLFDIETDNSDVARELYEGDSYFTFSNITNTAASSSYALGIQQTLASTNSDGSFDFAPKEFGIVMTIVSIIPVMPFIGGSREDIFAPTDGYRYFNPNYANTGSTPIYMRHLCDNTASFNATIGGYRAIYDRYREGYNILGTGFRTIYKDLVVRKTLTDPSYKVISPGEYAYLFSVLNQPQVRIFGMHEVQANLPIPKVYNPSLPKDTL